MSLNYLQFNQVLSKVRPPKMQVACLKEMESTDESIRELAVQTKRFKNQMADLFNTNQGNEHSSQYAFKSVKSSHSKC